MSPRPAIPARPFYANLRRALIGSYVVVAVSLCAAAIAYSAQDRTERIADAIRNATTLARALDEHVRRTFDAVDVLLADVATRITEEGGIPQVSEGRVHRTLRAKQELLPQVNGMFVYGPDSILYAGSSRVPSPRLDGSATEYVKAHRSDTTPSLFVGLPQPSPVSGLPTLPTTRRIAGPGDSFGGVVGASLDPRRLEAFYRDLGLASSQSLALMRADGMLLLRIPRSPDFEPGADLSGTPLFTEGINKAAIGAVRYAGAIDGLEKIIAYRSIPDPPLVVAVSHDVAEILAPWRRNAKKIAAGVTGALAALFAPTSSASTSPSGASRAPCWRARSRSPSPGWRTGR